MGKEDLRPGPSDPPSSAVSDSEGKHFSKAQFVWQIKGKYHLKCSTDETTEANRDNSSSTGEIAESCDMTAEVETDSDSDDSTLTSSQPSGDTDSSNWTFSDPPNIWMSPLIDKSRVDCPVRKWQTRQVAKAFVDNTINCVLEDMGFVPLPADTEDMINDGNLEHEAVSMAILSHGLQRSDHDTNTTSSHVVSSNSYSASLEKECSPLTDFHNRILNINKIKSMFDESPVSPSQMEPSCSTSSSNPVSQNSDCLSSESTTFVVSTVDDKTFEQSEVPFSDSSSKLKCALHSKNVESHSGRENIDSTICDLPSSFCTCNLPHKVITSTDMEITPFHKRKAEAVTSESNKRCCDGIVSSPSRLEVGHSSSSQDDSNVSRLYEKVTSFEHFDFIDAAVAAAIQKKGLSAMTCMEYG